MGANEFDRAFHDLLTRRAAPLYRYLSRLSEDPAAARSVTEKSFLRLYRRARMPETPAAWLTSLAQLLLQDKRPDPRDKTNTLSATEAIPATEAAALALDLAASARRALAHLPDRDKRALLLRHEGYDYREIGEICALSAWEVGPVLARASEAFRDGFDELHHTSD